MSSANTNEKNNETGSLGERVAAEFLERKGYSVIDRNYRKKWGEIDLVLLKDSTIHFVEVKTVSHETRAQLEDYKINGNRLEERVNIDKYRKLERTIASWIAAENYNGEYQLDLVTVRLVPHETYAQVEYFERIVVD